jgi:hypothetical protein
LLSGFAAALLLLSSAAGGFAQQVTTPTAASTPSFGSWTGGGDASGANTYVGRIEAPANRRSVNQGSNLLVSGWAADTTAQGWAGFDMMSVYSGTRESGTKLADGAVGLTRTDISDAFGPNFAKSGFSAVVPASALANLSTGATNLNVYLHTPNKGWWYKSVAINLTAAPTLAFPTDPIVTFTRPIDGEIITERQVNNKYTVSGFALDRNPPAPGQNPGGGASGCHCGIASVLMYIDATPGMPGYTPTQNDLGVGNVGPCGIGCGFGPLVNNCFKCYGGPAIDFSDRTNGTGTSNPGYSYVTANYGPQFDLSGFAFSINPAAYNSALPPSGQNIQPNMFHTLYAVATSSITGRVSVAKVTFYIRGTPSNENKSSIRNP